MCLASCSKTVCLPEVWVAKGQTLGKFLKQHLAPRGVWMRVKMGFAGQLCYLTSGLLCCLQQSARSRLSALCRTLIPRSLQSCQVGTTAIILQERHPRYTESTFPRPRDSKQALGTRSSPSQPLSLVRSACFDRCCTTTF